MTGRYSSGVMRGRPFYERLAAGSFLFVPAAYLLLGAILLALGDRPPPGVLRILTVASAASVVGALLIVWTPRLLVASLVVGVLILLVGLGPGAFGLGHPDSFFDFMTSLVTVVGALGAVVAAASALRLQHRGVSRDSRGIDRALVKAALVCLAIAAISSALLTRTHRTNAAAPAGATVVELRIDKFVPSTLHVTRGERTRVFVVNRDSYAHTFSVDALSLDEYIAPHATRLITFDVPASGAGRLSLYCAVTGHENMTGTIFIEPRA